MATQLSATRLPGDHVDRLGERPSIRDEGERAAIVDTAYARRARYFDSSNAFNVGYPPVPCHQFLKERDRALDPATGTAMIPLDLSERLEIDFPATTPLILTRYVRIGAGDALTPPGGVHSHHNDGDETMTCLIVQDGGLYYHCRTMGFEYAD